MNLVVKNISIIADPSTYIDGNYHYIASFELYGYGRLDHYKVEYSSDGGTSYIDITNIATLVDGKIYYYNSVNQDHKLRITPIAIQVNLISTLPSYDSFPDYTTSIQNRFDQYDGNPKTLIYKSQQNKWVGAYLYLPDCMVYMGSKLYGFKNGNLFLHNENLASFNVIYGEQLPQRICFPINVGDPSVVKDVMDIAIEGNGKLPNYTVLYSNYSIEQITDLVDTDYEAKEGVLYSYFLRDRLSGNSATVIDALLNGDHVTSAAPMVMIEWSTFDSQLEINFCNIGVNISKGHLSILNK